MKILLDTNVFVSGVFFGGPPRKILEAWRDDKIQLLLSTAILEARGQVYFLGVTSGEESPGAVLKFELGYPP